MKTNKLLTFFLVISLPFTNASFGQPQNNSQEPKNSESPMTPSEMPPTEDASNQEATPPEAVPEKSELPYSEFEQDAPSSSEAKQDQEPREVGQAAADGFTTSKRKQLGNVAIALLAIAVAATTIILVSRHEGKRG